MRKNAVSDNVFLLSTETYTKKLTSTAVRMIVTRFERISEKKCFQASPLFSQLLLHRIPEPIVGTIKQSQITAISPRIVRKGTPLIRLVETITTTAKAVRKERNICTAYIFGILGFASSIFLFCSSTVNLSNPINCMWIFPMGVFGEYQSVPTNAAITAPTSDNRSIVSIMCKCCNNYITNSYVSDTQLKLFQPAQTLPYLISTSTSCRVIQGGVHGALYPAY